MTIDATTLMRLLPARPRLLGLGEPTHGENVLLEVRNELFRQLAERDGYRTIAIESDCLAGVLVDDYVTAGVGTLDDVMARGFSHGLGAAPANRDLVRWMRAYNDGRPESERVRFAGFDGPLEIAAAASPRAALTALYAYLRDLVPAALLPCTAETLDRLLGPDDRWTEPAAMHDPARSAGRSPDADRLRLLTDDLVALLDAHAPAAASSAGDRARTAARTAAGLLRYHRWMADPGPGRLTGLLSTRAAMMAGNLLAVAERGPALAFAHHSHLQRPKSTMHMGGGPLEWWSAGAIAAAALGDGYAFVPVALGTIRHRGVDTPPPGTVEGHLYALPDDRYVVDARALPADAQPRVSPWFGYAPLDPAHVPGLDALVFVRDAPEDEPWWPVA